jgi:hypothetical protein
MVVRFIICHVKSSSKGGVVREVRSLRGGWVVRCAEGFVALVVVVVVVVVVVG